MSERSRFIPAEAMNFRVSRTLEAKKQEPRTTKKPDRSIEKAWERAKKIKQDRNTGRRNGSRNS